MRRFLCVALSRSHRLLSWRLGSSDLLIVIASSFNLVTWNQLIAILALPACCQHITNENLYTKRLTAVISVVVEIILSLKKRQMVCIWSGNNFYWLKPVFARVVGPSWQVTSSQSDECHKWCFRHLAGLYSTSLKQSIFAAEHATLVIGRKDIK